MQGKIIKGIAGFYYVHIEKQGVYECKAKGIFRKENKKPLVGDDVLVQILSEEEKTGNIEEILPRENELIRPAVANIDQAVIIFAMAKPNPNLNLLDRFLIMMESRNLPCIICLNKEDIVSADEKDELKKAYTLCGYPMVFTSVKEEKGMEQLRELLRGKTSAVAGPSGVGKSTIINYLYPKAAMETGEISQKIERGKHTTRHSQLFAIEEKTYIMDTPGFSSLGLFEVEKEELGQFYPEFMKYEENCKFRGCAHISEPGCAVKTALEEGKISRVRYENYCVLYEELKQKKKY